MRISVSEDIAAPASHVFAQATDAAAFERQALRRGAEVRRLDRQAGLGTGATWQVRFPYRGRERRLTVAVERLDPPGHVAARLEGGGLRGQSTADLVTLGRGTTRLTLAMDLEATSLGSRILLQALRLGRGGIERRMGARLKAWARGVELAWAQRPAGRA